MADTLNTILNLLVKPQLVSSAFGGTFPFTWQFAPSPLLHGTAINQVDLAHLAEYTLSTTPTVLDLIGGGLIGLDRGVFNPAKMVGVAVYNTSVIAAEIASIGGGTNGWNTWLAGTTGVKVGPGGVGLNINPSLAAWGVTAGTGDLFPMVSAAGTPLVRVAFLGRSV